ncbi:SDR family oxidoreductase [Sporolactobacillus sp. CQH2019]|uniref:SDR family oxidoreductase n=1 Tax=Sporolactobacillus sp. CQH2019 TaxID=3023512 RepID=UPI00236815B3|nr:SDR family oxidoreductase [Sporolactobacillus sp. CQH2019]MDD9147625.1 SDR family oxidoreductase [Sporolactobacillus sp. CQH2019]
MDLGLKGKRALILASSKGLGRAIAGQLVSEGAEVILSSRSADHLKKTAEELNRLSEGASVTYFPADVSKKDDLDALSEFAGLHFGRLDILVNNAGGPPSGAFLSLTDEDWQKAFELNLLSYIRTIRFAVPLMEKSGGGRIINIASSSIKKPIDGLVLSNTFRLGIVGLTKTLAGELADKNILVNTLAPGRIATDRVAELDRRTSERTGVAVQDVRTQSEAEIPLGRYGRPEEFARAAAFLASDACSYVTGESLLVDGGLVRSI